MCAVVSVVMLARRRVAKRLDWRGMLIDGTATEKTEEWVPPGSGYGENEGCGNWVVCHLYYRYLDREGHAKVIGICGTAWMWEIDCLCVSINTTRACTASKAGYNNPTRLRA